jgi:uncharacterized protein YkwD
MTTLIRRASAVATATAALFGGLLLGPSPASAATATPSTNEAKVVKLTNDARVRNGCSALRTDAKLTAAARAHSADMAKANYFSHTGRDGSTFVARAKRAGYNSAIGENIAWGYRTPAAVMDGWMNSSGHRANILNCRAKAVGVGVAKKADGTPYWTQVFGSV